MDFFRYSNLKNLSEKEIYDIKLAMGFNRFLFGKIILGDPELPMHYHIRKESPPFHREIDDILAALMPGEKYGCAAPRGHAKTTFIDLLYPLQRITFGYERFVLMISESEDQSILNLETLANEIEFNPKYKFFFGNRKTKKTWGSTAIIVVTKFADKSAGTNAEYCKVMIRGTGQKVRGLKFGPYRPTLTVVDDGEGEANALTDDARLKFRRWLNAQVIPGSDSGKFVFIGTIIDTLAYLNRICGSEAYKEGKYIVKGWKHSFYQSTIQNVPEGTFKGEGFEIMDVKRGEPKVLWPERRPYSWLKRERDRLESEGDLQFYFQEYQNIAADDTFRVFKESDNRYWQGHYQVINNFSFLVIKDDDGEVRTVPVNIFIGVDPASSENVKADFTVIMVIAVDRDHNVYVIEYFRGQVSPMDGADRLWEMMEKYYIDGPNRQPKLVNIEKTGHQMLASYILRLSKVNNRWFPIEPRDAIGNKFYRIKELQPRHGSHSLLWKREHTVLTQEAQYFRNFGKFKKDTLDALRWAIEDSFAPEDLDYDRIMSNDTMKPVAVGMDWQTGQEIVDVDEYVRNYG